MILDAVQFGNLDFKVKPVYRIIHLLVIVSRFLLVFDSYSSKRTVFELMSSKPIFSLSYLCIHPPHVVRFCLLAF